MAVGEDPDDPQPRVGDRPDLAVALAEGVVVKRLADRLDLDPVDVDADGAHAGPVEPPVAGGSLGERLPRDEVRVRGDEPVRGGAGRELRGRRRGRGDPHEDSCKPEQQAETGAHRDPHRPRWRVGATTCWNVGRLIQGKLGMSTPDATVERVSS